MNLNTWLAMRTKKHFQLKGLYSTRNRRRRRKPAYPWLLRSAATPKELAKHRATLEADCFTSPSHRKLMRQAAKEYDRLIEREKAAKKDGRPKKLQPLDARRAA